MYHVTLCVCSTEELNSYLGETEGLVLVDKYVSELPLVRIAMCVVVYSLKLMYLFLLFI